MFTVVWEFVPPEQWADPDAVWEPHTGAYETEAEAVGKWCDLRLFENTRPVSIDPEPDWSRYSYDGRTPLSKW